MLQQPASTPVITITDTHLYVACSSCCAAPDLVDDYYLNLLDWSSGNQVWTPMLPRLLLQHMECTRQSVVVVFTILAQLTYT
jgi:hypothetical protein